MTAEQVSCLRCRSVYLIPRGLDDYWSRRAVEWLADHECVPVVHEPAACGTPSGYNRHHRRGEPACVDCKQASAKAKRENWRNRRAVS